MANPHSVLLVKGNYGRAGGPETLLTSILAHLDETRFRPTLVLLRKPGGLDAFGLTADGLTASQQEIEWHGLLAAPLAAWSLDRVRRSQDARLIHTHDMRAHLAAYLLARVRAFPWIAQVHGWLGPTHAGRWRVYERIDQRLVRHADLVLVGSTAALREVKALGVRHVRVVPNAVTIPPLGTRPEAAQQVRDQLNASPTSVIVGVVGRVHPGKGQTILLRALAQLKAKGFDVRGLIVGEGPDLRNLQRLTQELGLQQMVTMTGFCPDVVPYMAAMDVVVMPSLKESLPLTALEAMSLQKPVIASRVGDLPELITHGVNGMLVQPGAVSDLSQTLETLILDAALRQHLGQRARDLVSARFSAETMTRTLETIYAEVMAGRNPACV
jgi:glycosyltransferase involved in cell wall biosynthesis